MEKPLKRVLFDLFIPVLVKKTTGGPNKGRNGNHVTQDSTYKYGQDHRGTLCRGGQTAFFTSASTTS